MSGSFRRSSRISVNDFSSMNRTEVTELHYLAPIANVRSIMERGLLSHHRASRLSRIDISMQEVQDTRAKKHVPGGLSLHDYVNLYFNGRNKMMAKRRPLHDRICVLRVRTAALEIEGGVIADQNASSKYALFMASPAGLRKLDHDEVFVRSWKFPNDQIREWRLGSKVCAELLVPHQLPPEYIFGAFVHHATTQALFQATGANIPCVINPDVFLR
jgi:ssDNA thymidine ADP-ribosyltransferase, DarT